MPRRLVEPPPARPTQTMEPSDDLKRPRARLKGDTIILGIDVGSTTVKAVVIDPDTKQILWSDYQRHETRQAEKVLELLVAIGGEFDDIPRENIRAFITGSGCGPAPRADRRRASSRKSTPSRWRWITCIPTSAAVIELGGQDAKIIIYQENQQTGDKRAIASMNDKCASGTGATIDKCMIKAGHGPGRRVPAAVGLLEDPPRRRQVRRLRGNRHRQPGEVGHSVERDPLLAGRRDRHAEPVGADARQHAQAAASCCSAAPTPTCRSCRQCWRQRIPETWETRGFEWPKDVPIEELIFVPKDAQYYAAFGAAIYGIHEPAECRPVSRARSAEGVHRQRPQGEARRDGRAAAGR